jgi:hypothetical protein
MGGGDDGGGGGGGGEAADEGELVGLGMGLDGDGARPGFVHVVEDVVGVIGVLALARLGEVVRLGY